MLNSARHLKSHALSNGKLGVTGFCWGGSTTNYLPTAMGADLTAGAPYYGAAVLTPVSRDQIPEQRPVIALKPSELF